NIF
ncbi:hypothetical protein CLOM_g21415, partial [Closterium sp. NIES-68]